MHYRLEPPYPLANLVFHFFILSWSSMVPSWMIVQLGSLIFCSVFWGFIFLSKLTWYFFFCLLIFSTNELESVFLLTSLIKVLLCILYFLVLKFLLVFWQNFVQYVLITFSRCSNFFQIQPPSLPTQLCVPFVFIKAQQVKCRMLIYSWACAFILECGQLTIGYSLSKAIYLSPRCH